MQKTWRSNVAQEGVSSAGMQKPKVKEQVNNKIKVANQNNKIDIKQEIKDRVTPVNAKQKGVKHRDLVNQIFEQHKK